MPTPPPSPRDIRVADGVTLRRPRPEDARAHAELLGHPGVQPWLLQTPYTSEQLWHERFSKVPDVNSGELVLLAFDGERLVGSAGLHPVGPQARRRHAMMLGISVHPDAHGRGVGSALMDALTRQADDWLGVLRIELTVFVDNAPAIRLYERFGFETEGRLRAYGLRGGRYVDVLTMARLHPRPPVIEREAL
ncbi:GNAT family N-acetyltransferase [Mitsuaria sp. GD03876]|uniref:GNAT family N-acetyltransferase n=1 Tax=Mitsuaria sp. GD03876 TaxID=2975399 RepID=UPI00244943CD|nr:GNAT family N-acetyltransferase [Mitsuaria sp. GD03876]MDH0867846.1 GNAT family N-acetyltransferase [Mitsuaria sp. GD03876]